MSELQLAQLARDIREATAKVNAVAAMARTVLGQGSKVLHEAATAELALVRAGQSLADLRRERKR